MQIFLNFYYAIIIFKDLVFCTADANAPSGLKINALHIHAHHNATHNHKGNFARNFFRICKVTFELNQAWFVCFPERTAKLMRNFGGCLPNYRCRKRTQISCWRVHSSIRTPGDCNQQDENRKD